MFQYFPIFSNMFQYFPTCSNIFQYFPIFSNMFQYFPIFSNMFQYFPTCSNIFQYFPIFSNMFQYFPICSNIFQYVPIFSSMFQYPPILWNVSNRYITNHSIKFWGHLWDGFRSTVIQILIGWDQPSLLAVEMPELDGRSSGHQAIDQKTLPPTSVDCSTWSNYSAWWIMTARCS